MVLRSKKILRVGARDSKLSRIQVAEVARLYPYFEFREVFVKTMGDLDKNRSLRGDVPSNFFTKELDDMLLRGEVDMTIHSAKDLPDPLPEGLLLWARTPPLDTRDSLVLPVGRTLASFVDPPRIATSSERREEMVRECRSDCLFVDVRGTIDERLSLLDAGVVEGVVVAECALQRLQYTERNRIFLPGTTAPGQGSLAMVVRKSFHLLHSHPS